jgi:alpha-tubulin suppressor-like RCC1 family protein
MVIEPTLL